MKTNVKDLPREECVALANETMEKLGAKAKVHFKFTCPKCGTRCTFTEPNMLFERGTCFHCGADEPVTHAGFSLEFQV